MARLNMCHGTHEWHKAVIDRIRSLNKSKGYSVAIMVDTEGSEVHINELEQPLKAEEGDEVTVTIRDALNKEGAKVLGISYEAFIDDVQVLHVEVVLVGENAMSARCITVRWGMPSSSTEAWWCSR